MHLFSPKRRYLNNFSTLASCSFSIEYDSIESADKIPMTVTCIGAFAVEDENRFADCFYARKASAEEVVEQSRAILQAVLEKKLRATAAMDFLNDIPGFTEQISAATAQELSDCGLELKRFLINHARDNLGLVELKASVKTAGVYEQQDKLDKAHEVWSRSIEGIEKLPDQCKTKRFVLEEYGQFLERAGRAVDAAEIKLKVKSLATSD